VNPVTNVGNDRSQLAGVAKQTKDTLRRESLDVTRTTSPTG
jgi:hypothetical protein